MPRVRCSSDLYAGTDHTLQHKSRSKTTTHKRLKEDASRSGQGTADAKTTTTPNDPNKDASRSGQGAAEAREADPVRHFLVITVLFTSAHVPLDTTSH